MNEQNFFFGRLDLDTTVEFISKEDQSYALNIVRGPEKTGKAKTMLGTSAISYTPPVGINTVIGCGVNIQTNSIIAMIHNSNDDHQIIDVFPDTGVVEIVMSPKTGFNTDWLQFDTTKRIDHINIFNGQITWTDGSTPIGPAHIDIEAAKGFMLGTASTADQFVYPAASFSTIERRIQSVRAIKYLPMVKPFIQYTTLVTKETNLLKRKTWQIAYRYHYFDNTYSCLSPYSDVIIPDEEDTAVGGLFTSDKNNQLSIQINSGHPNVKNIEICFRNGNNKPFYTIDKLIKKYDDDNQSTGIGNYSTILFEWAGQDVGYQLGVEELLNYDAIPYLAKTQSYLHNNRLVYGNYEIDRESTKLNVSISDVWTKRTGIARKSGFTLTTTGAATSGPDAMSIPASLNLTEGDAIYIILQHSSDSGYPLDTPGTTTKSYPFTYIVKANDLLSYPANLTGSLKSMIEDHTDFTITVATNSLFITGTPGGSNRKFFSAASYESESKIVTHKKGAWHEYGIVYLDEAGRSGPGNTSDSSRFYVPWYSEEVGGQVLCTTPAASGQESSNWEVALNMNINHSPPSWAKYYQITYGGKNISYFIQGYAEGITMSDEFGSPTKSSLRVKAFSEKISDVDSISYSYEFQEGDRIRFIGTQVLIATSDTNVLDRYIDVEILSYDPALQRMEIESSDFNAEIAHFEIYRPIPETKSNDHYAVTDVIPIVNGFHTGDIQTQTASLPAVHNIKGGDCYIYNRDIGNVYQYTRLSEPITLGVKIIAKQESMNMSDFYNSADISQGKPILIDNNHQPRAVENEIVHGGVYAVGSNINEIFKFDANNAIKVDFKNGAIMAMRVIGRTLKVLQESNLNSVYIEQAYINQGKNRVLSTTDSVFGFVEPSPNNWGTKNPESVYVNDRHLFYYDTDNRAVVRDAPNGSFVISKYKAETFFRDKAEEDFFLIGYDDYSGLLVCTVGNETISFLDDGSNRWNSFHSFIPESAASINRHLITFKNGQPWIHNNKLNPCNYYGVQYSAAVKITVNQNPSMTKSFQNIELKASSIWSADNDSDISVNSGKMISRLIASNFREKDGQYYAEFLRDLNTPNIPVLERILEGRRLTGNHIEVKLSITPTKEEDIFSVTTHSVPSQKTA